MFWTFFHVNDTLLILIFREQFPCDYFKPSNRKMKESKLMMSFISQFFLHFFHGFSQLLRKLYQKSKNYLLNAPTRSETLSETLLHLNIGTGCLIE